MAEAQLTYGGSAVERPEPFLPLRDQRIERGRFGAKAEILSRLCLQSRVPDGFALDLRLVEEHGLDLMEVLTDIHAELSGTGSKLIVRSSAAIEDAAPSLFPGRFESLRDLSTVGELYDGIQDCVLHAADSLRVREYREAHDWGGPITLSSVLIQRQVPADFGGVVFTRAPRPYHDYHALIELIEGPASGLLAGSALGGLYGVEPGPAAERYTQLAGPAHALDDLTKVLDAVMLEARKAERLLGEPQDIEWVWWGGKLWIVQARPARVLLPARHDVAADEPALHSRIRPPSGPLPLSMVAKLGQKAAAARYFKSEGCGAPNMQTLNPEWDDDRVRKELGSRNIGPHGTVVRFSSVEAATAGLPVAFVAADDGDLGTAYVELRRRAGDGMLAGIVSDYMFVEHAFEAYVDTTRAIVEHVPGNWEPQNNLRPDVLVFEDDSVHGWRVTERRRASFELPSAAQRPASLLRDVEPVDEDQLMEWGRELQAFLKKFRRKFHNHLPLNFHFVRVGENWHFLNIRPTRDLPVTRSHRTPQSEFKRQRLFLVTAPDDLRSWDGAAPILLTLTPDRPDAECLATLASALHEEGITTVYTSFGVLSHPALVLREFGLEVQPMYDHYDLVEPARLG